MSDTTAAALPAYTDDDIRNRLLAAGASGTVYALVTPETEDAVRSMAARPDEMLERHREPWTRKQDAMHREWFDEWIRWASPVVEFDAGAFPHRYPTAGASEGIAKVMGEWAARTRARGGSPVVHVFEGEYEGFRAFAGAYGVPVVAHDRSDWPMACDVEGDAQFWISQPSAIDGMVWPHLKEFAERLHQTSPQVELVPDLSYVGAVARPYRIVLDLPNVRTVALSHSKPFGIYYKRVGGVLSKDEIGSLVGNEWFKNIDSIALGLEMMRRHDVFALPRRYREVQERCAAEIGRRLGVEGLRAADVMVMGVAPPVGPDDPAAPLLRGGRGERMVRVCLTPAMTVAIDPDMAPEMAKTMVEGRGG